MAYAQRKFPRTAGTGVRYRALPLVSNALWERCSRTGESSIAAAVHPSALEEATRTRRVDGSRFEIELVAAWSTPEGRPQGGYVLAAAMRAAREASGRPHVVTATGHFLRPAQLGACEVTATVLRAGRRYDVVDLRLTQDGRTCMAALATLSDLDAASGPSHDVAMPEFPPMVPLGSPPFPMPLNDHFFLDVPKDQNDFLAGDLFEHPTVYARVRHPDGEAMGELLLPVLADWRPPGPWTIGIFGAIPTVELDVHVLAPPPYQRLWCQYTMDALRDGQAVETTRFWDDDGRLVATARQLYLVLPPD